MIVDVANLPGVTSNESIENKIDTLGFIQRRISVSSANCEEKICKMWDQSSG